MLDWCTACVCVWGTVLTTTQSTQLNKRDTSLQLSAVQFKQGTCMHCLGGAGGLVLLATPPHLSADISSLPLQSAHVATCFCPCQLPLLTYPPPTIITITLPSHLMPHAGLPLLPAALTYPPPTIITLTHHHHPCCCQVPRVLLFKAWLRLRHR